MRLACLLSKRCLRISSLQQCSTLRLQRSGRYIMSNPTVLGLPSSGRTSLLYITRVVSSVSVPKQPSSLVQDEASDIGPRDRRRRQRSERETRTPRESRKGETWNPLPTDMRLSSYLRMPVGAMSESHWNEVFSAVRFWSGMNTDEGVSKSWKLLDRLIDEFRVFRKCHDDAKTTNRLIMKIGMAIKWATRSWTRTPTARFSGPDLADRYYRDYVDVISPLPRHIGRGILRASTMRDDSVHAFRVADTMLEFFHKKVDLGHKQFQPPIGLYADALYVYCHYGGANSEQKVDALLKRVEETEGMQPTLPMYVEAVTAHANSRTTYAGRRARELYEAAEHRGLKPDITLQNAVMNAIAKSKTPDAAEQAEAYLNRMTQTNNSSFSIAIAAYAREGKFQKFEALLRRMNDTYMKTKDPSLQPDCIVYNSILDGLSKAGGIDAARRAEEMLQRLYDMAEDTGNPALRPDRISFNSVMDAWARSGEDIAPHRAEVILQRMQDLSDSGMTEMSPDVVSFSTILNCWAKSRLPGSAKRAENILHRMIELCDGGRSELKPNIVVYSTVLDAIANSDESDAPERALKVFRLMKQKRVPPGRHAYSALMTTWARSRRRNAPEKAEAIMNEMRAKSLSGDTMLDPDNSFMFTNLLHTYARAGRPKEAEETLRHMEVSFKEGNEKMKPTVIAYSAVLSAWARSSEANATDRAISIFSNMLSRHQEGDPAMRLNTSAFNAFLSTFGNSKDLKKAVRVETFLSRMKSLSRNGDTDCKPNRVTYGCVINALGSTGHSRAIDRIYELLEEMKASVDPYVRPTARTYINVLQAIRRSKLPDKAERAEAILRSLKMDGSFHHINLHTIHDVLRCCVSSGSRESMDVALRVWHDITKPSSHVKPTALTCKLVLSICSNDRDPSGNQSRLEQVYRQGCDLGYGRHPGVLKTLKKVSGKQYKTLLSLQHDTGVLPLVKP